MALNGPVDRATAEALAETFLEAIVAPAVSEDARALLSAKKNLRLLELGALSRDNPLPQLAPLEMRSIGDGFLVQEFPDVLADDEAALKVVTKRAPTSEEMKALRFGWAIVKHVRSNAIVFAAADRTLAISAGGRPAASRGGRAGRAAKGGESTRRVGSGLGCLFSLFVMGSTPPCAQGPRR